MDPITTSVINAAKMLGLGRTSIYVLIRDKQLDTVKLGRRTLITVESINRLVATALTSTGH